MKKTTSFLALALSVLLCMTLLPGCASAAGGAEPSVEKLSSVDTQAAARSGEVIINAENQPTQPTQPEASAAASLTFATAPDTAAPPAVVATPTKSAVLVNGETVSFDAYNIDGSNYFKLRDLAQALRGSKRQFEVSWDGALNAINLISGAAYTSVGGELAQGDGAKKDALVSTASVYLDGQKLDLTAYNIGGSNYFKLRDLGQALDFDVAWDAGSEAVIIDGNNSYGTWDAVPADEPFALEEETESFSEIDKDTGKIVWDHSKDMFPGYEGEKEGYWFDPFDCVYKEIIAPTWDDSMLYMSEEEKQQMIKENEEFVKKLEEMYDINW